MEEVDKKTIMPLTAIIDTTCSKDFDRKIKEGFETELRKHGFKTWRDKRSRLWIFKKEKKHGDPSPKEKQGMVLETRG